MVLVCCDSAEAKAGSSLSDLRGDLSPLTKLFADEPDGGARHCGDAGCGDTRHHVPTADGAGGPATGLLQQSAGVPAPPPPAGPALRTAEEEVRGRARKAD